MIPQFGTLVLIRNTYLWHTKMEDTFHCNFTGSTIFVQTLKLWENCLLQVSHEARRQSTAGQAKYMALKCLLDKRNHLTFFWKTPGKMFLSWAHTWQARSTNGCWIWEIFLRKHRFQHLMKIGKNLFRFLQKFLKNVSLLVWVSFSKMKLRTTFCPKFR